MRSLALIDRRRLLVIPTIDGLWALVAVAVPTAGAFLGRMMAIDIAYQIRAGAVMLDTHQLLDVDTFTFTVFGHPWLNQQWAAEVIFASIYRVGGWGAVALARGLLFGFIVAVLYRTCRGNGASPRTAAVLTLAASLVGLELLPAMRPQLLAFLLFALALWAVTTRLADPIRVWWVPVLVVPWVNIHGSFPLIFVLLGLAWLEDHRRDSRSARRLVLVAAAAMAASFVNPFGAGAWSYAVNLSTDPEVVRQIAEWGPPSVYTFTGVFFFASLFAVGGLLARRPGTTTWWDLLTLLLFAAVGLVAVRGVGWWAMVAPVVMARVLHDERTPRDTRRPVLHLLFAIAVASLVVVALLPLGSRDPATGGPAVLTYAPDSLIVAAERSSPAGTRAFVSQVYGSWTEFSAPSIPVMVDARIELFPAPVWDDYFAVSEGVEGWEDVLDRWKVELLILDPTQAEGLLRVLPEHPEWRHVVSNASGAVYART